MDAYTCDVTFDYTLIEDVEGEPITKAERARAQWLLEFMYAMNELDTSEEAPVQGFLLVDDLAINHPVRRWVTVVRLTVAGDLDRKEIVEYLQDRLYDRGGLSGEFVLGRAREITVPYTVTFDSANVNEQVTFNTLVIAVDEEEAEQIVVGLVSPTINTLKFE